MFDIVSHLMVLKLCVPGMSIAMFAPPNKMNEQFIQSGGGKASLRSCHSVFFKPGAKTCIGYCQDHSHISLLDRLHVAQASSDWDGQSQTCLKNLVRL